MEVLLVLIALDAMYVEENTVFGVTRHGLKIAIFIVTNAFHGKKIVPYFEVLIPKFAQTSDL